MKHIKIEKKHLLILEFKDTLKEGHIDSILGGIKDTCPELKVLISQPNCEIILLEIEGNPVHQ